MGLGSTIFASRSIVGGAGEPRAAHIGHAPQGRVRRCETLDDLENVILEQRRTRNPVQSIGLLFLAAIGSLRTASQDIRDLPLDVLISRLPPAGCGGTWDEKRGFAPDPADAELRRRLAAGEKMTDAQWEHALIGSGVFRFHSKWPAELPFSMSVREPSWTSEGTVETGTHVHAVPTEPTLKEIEGGELIHFGCGTFEDARRAITDYQELGRLGLGAHKLIFDVFVDTTPGLDRSRASSQAWRGAVAIDIEIVPSLEQAIPPADSPELRDLVRRSLCRFPPGEGQGVFSTSVNVAFLAGGADAQTLAATAFSLEIGLWRKGEFVGSGSTRVTQLGGFRPCQTAKSRWGAEGVELGPTGRPESMATDSLADFEVRVRGVSKDVLRHWGAKTWWNGTISVPLTDLPVHR